MYFINNEDIRNLILGIFKYIIEDRIFKFLKLFTSNGVFYGETKFCFSNHKPSRYKVISKL